MKQVLLMGYGYWGRNVARTMREAGLQVAVHDPDERARDRAREAGFRPVRTPDEYDSDAVAICAPPDQHHDLISMALDAGKHVWTEKPIALNVYDAHALVLKAQSKGLVLFVDHTFEFAPAVERLATEIGSMRKIDHIEVVRTHLVTHLSVPPRDGSDIISDLLPHEVSIFLKLGMKPKLIRASSRVTDADVEIKFDSGYTANIYYSWDTALKQRKMTFYGPERTIVYDHLHPHAPITVYSVSGGDKRSEWTQGEIVCPPVSSAEPLGLAVKAFKNALQDPQLYPHLLDNTEAALEVQRVVDAARHSRGSWIS